MEIMILREFFIRGVMSLILVLMVLNGVFGQVNISRSKLVPDYAIMQYAGSLGVASIGFGYSVGKNDHTHLELLYGYTPKYESDSRMSSITIKALKTIFSDIPISRNNQLSWIPLKSGLGLSYIADNRFFSFRTDLPYAPGYYWHRTGLRSMLYFQTELVTSFESKVISQVSYYLEANIQDIYMTLKFADSNFTVYDMVKLGMGVRIKF
jgi:hypothetical protein